MPLKKASIQGAQSYQSFCVSAVELQQRPVGKGIGAPQNVLYRQLDAADMQGDATLGQRRANLREGFHTGDINAVNRLRKKTHVARVSVVVQMRLGCFMRF